MKETSDATDQLAQMARLQERPFTSTVPVVGPLLARFRSAWNSVSTKWYVRPIVQQQSAFNSAAAKRLEILESYIDSLEIRLLEQDREVAALRREAAELALRVRLLEQQLRTSTPLKSRESFETKEVADPVSEKIK